MPFRIVAIIFSVPSGSARWSSTFSLHVIRPAGHGTEGSAKDWGRMGAGPHAAAPNAHPTAIRKAPAYPFTAASRTPPGARLLPVSGRGRPGRRAVGRSHSVGPGQGLGLGAHLVDELGRGKHFGMPPVRQDETAGLAQRLGR